MLGHCCLLLLELLLLLLVVGGDCRCRSNCVHLLLLGCGGSVHANHSLLVRSCLLQANPLGVLLNGGCGNDLAATIILHGRLLWLLLWRWLLSRPGS